METVWQRLPEEAVVRTLLYDVNERLGYHKYCATVAMRSAYTYAWMDQGALSRFAPWVLRGQRAERRVCGEVWRRATSSRDALRNVCRQIAGYWVRGGVAAQARTLRRWLRVLERWMWEVRRSGPYVGISKVTFLFNGGERPDYRGAPWEIVSMRVEHEEKTPAEETILTLQVQELRPELEADWRHLQMWMMWVYGCSKCILEIYQA